jgi:hypothetical protein
MNSTPKTTEKNVAESKYTDKEMKKLNNIEKCQIQDNYQRPESNPILK